MAYGKNGMETAMKKRAYKLTMEDGTEHLVCSEMSMLDIGNELRSKAKVSFTGLSGEKIALKSQAVRYTENYSLHANHTGKEVHP